MVYLARTEIPQLQIVTKTSRNEIKKKKARFKCDLPAYLYPLVHIFLFHLIIKCINDKIHAVMKRHTNT